jgi:hypothetical protein
MTDIEHLLMCLAEEGCEIAQDCSKINRFGINDVYTHIDAGTELETRHPEKGTNRERLIEEVWTKEREEFFAKIGRAMENVILQLKQLDDPKRALQIADSGRLLEFKDQPKPKGQ